MTREQIEKEIDVRLEEPDNEWDGIFNSGYSRGFRDGSQWRINAVWNDATNIPKKGEQIVVVFRSGNFTSWNVSDDIVDVFKRFDVILWSYSKDLLPERKEVTK